VAQLSLVVRQVHLDLDRTTLAAARAVLSQPERAHADRGSAPVARRRAALRATLRHLAGEMLGLDSSAVPISAGDHGRPELLVPGMDLGCSRSGGIGVVAVVRGSRLGIDVERVLPWDDGVLAEQWLAPSERAELTALDPAARSLAATRCWTRKEAVLKGLGPGLHGRPEELVVGTSEGPVLVAGWLVVPVPVPAGHVAALATHFLPHDVPAAPAAAERSSLGRDVS
jgi:4'-phosphopantetheinyl transferase